MYEFCFPFNFTPKIKLNRCPCIPLYYLDPSLYCNPSFVLEYNSPMVQSDEAISVTIPFLKQHAMGDKYINHTTQLVRSNMRNIHSIEVLGILAFRTHPNFNPRKKNYYVRKTFASTFCSNCTDHPTKKDVAYHVASFCSMTIEMVIPLHFRQMSHQTRC